MKYTLFAFLFCYCSLSAHPGFERVRTVRRLSVTIHVSEHWTLAYQDSAGISRYHIQNLPKELNVDGLKLCVDGDIGAIPPNVMMMGTPFRIKKAIVSKADQLKYKLSKRKYTIQ